MNHTCQDTTSRIGKVDGDVIKRYINPLQTGDSQSDHVEIALHVRDRVSLIDETGCQIVVLRYLRRRAGSRHSADAYDGVTDGRRRTLEHEAAASRYPRVVDGKVDQGGVLPQHAPDCSRINQHRHFY